MICIAMQPSGSLPVEMRDQEAGGKNLARGKVWDMMVFLVFVDHVWSAFKHGKAFQKCSSPVTKNTMDNFSLERKLSSKFYYSYLYFKSAFEVPAKNSMSML